jgi:hypothetical protein
MGSILSYPLLYKCMDFYINSYIMINNYFKNYFRTENEHNCDSNIVEGKTFMNQLKQNNSTKITGLQN